MQQQPKPKLKLSQAMYNLMMAAMAETCSC